MMSLESYIHTLESVQHSTITPLVPITSRISFQNDHESQERPQLFFKLQDLSVFTMAAVPEDFEAVAATMISDYERYLKIVDSDFERRAYADTLYYLTARYFSRFGSEQLEGVSLFDEIRIKAATGCSDSSEDSPFILIKGDISGIQDFIYGISDDLSNQVGEGTNRAKKLRGRSFYISLLTDTIADAIVHRMGLQESNILYCGGGHFTIIAPSESGMIDAVDEIRHRINNFFLDIFQLRLTLVLEYVEAPRDITENFSDTYLRLEKKIARSKKQKALSILESFESRFDRTALRQQDQRKEIIFRKIGGHLTRDCLLLEVFDEGIPIPEDKLIFKGLGIQWALLNSANSLTGLVQKLQGVRVRIFTLGNLEKFLALLDDAIATGLRSCAFGFKFFGNYAPREPNELGVSEVCDFEKLAEKGKEGELLSYPLLSVMRLDVDNLGAIFSFGLSDTDKTTSLYHVATLSRELVFFFCHHVNKVAERYSCYVTYSGGDDAFIVGSWINVIEFARELYKDFRSFSCGNKWLTFSAGIVQCNSHYPILQAGYESGKRETEAKNHDFSSGRKPYQKNAVNIFNKVVRWDVLIDQLRFAERCYDLFDPDSLMRSYSRSLLHRILSQLVDTIDETGAIDLSKLQVAISRLTWVFARSPNGVTNNSIVAFDNNKLSAVERLKVDFARRVIKGDGVELVINYSIITSYLLLRTRKKD
jgi:CRISPR-associated protein Csm1